MSNLKQKLIFEKSTLNFQVLNGIADLIRIIDLSNNVVFVNSSMEKILGGHKDFMYCSLDNLENTLCNTDVTRRCLETGEIIQREEIYEDKYYSVKCSPILDSIGNIIGVVEIFRNITVEKLLQIELTEKNKNMTMEMDHAKAIQQNLLPEKGFIGNLKVDYLYSPKERLSGDIFDVFVIDEDNVGMYISDSVGHGFAASMMTMFIRQTTINIPNKILINPALTLMEINKRFSELKLASSDYFTMVYIVYNRRNNEIKYSNAGHNCPIIILDEYGTRLYEAPGFPISTLFRDYKYENGRCGFYCGNKLLLFTDGIIEAKNIHGGEFGVDGVIESVRSENKDIISNIKKQLDQFTLEEQIDDLSLLLIDAY